VSRTEVGPLVSVVINSYNYARFLADAVESALAQTYPRCEVVVVDDGSTDGSAELLGRWQDRIRTVIKENGGQASALNAGWAESRGELVLLLDADDVLLPDTAARAVAARATGVATVQYPVELVDAELRPVGRTLPTDPLATGELGDRVRRGERLPATPTSGMALDRALADPLFPIPEADWRISADTYLALLLPLMGRVAALDSPGARYRLHGSNRWAAAAGLTTDRIRAQLRMDRHRQAALRRFVEVPADWLLRDVEHLQFRLASLRIEPDAHPVPGDRRIRLGGLGARAALRARGYRPAKRAGLALWFLAVAALPRQAAVAAIELAFHARPRSLRARARATVAAGVPE
jgi:glycosyltransferase involved in cell wall biosynthesis